MVCGSSVHEWPTTTSSTSAILALSNHGSRVFAATVGVEAGVPAVVAAT